ncbi:MFS transporter [Nereida sp. MMG025]|uniref:MFS transporter n=1 Tax=Nereida sp. MMG025 TaxID=2909981 RepID=UPI001F01727D|nr:MFS transporter [Nereida sp. MMG025]MCF6444478.1 MFS transporter [Nereida sp. MMG025]
MKAGIAALIFAYVLSQFYRAFLAVLTGVLGRDIGATPDDLAAASGLWFLTFACMQIPVGWALDVIGPRRTASSLLLVGAVGAFVFAFATSVTEVKLAMVLIGIGCSPVLMASYYIFAKEYSAAVFATLAGMVIGIGSLGNLASAAPTTWAVKAFGWRETLAGLGAITGLTAVALFFLIRDPKRPETRPQGSVLTLLKIPALWFIFPLMFVNYAPSAGLRGLWVGPYFTDVYAATPALIGTATLVMGLAMVLGNFAYGPSDRIFKTRKWVVFGGNALGGLACLVFALNPDPGVVAAIALFAAIGFLGASFPVVIAHARSFFPEHLTGRGVTLMNLFGIGGVGLFQMATGRVYEAAPSGAPAYSALFWMFAVAVAIGVTIYAFSQDRMD